MNSTLWSELSLVCQRLPIFLGISSIAVRIRRVIFFPQSKFGELYHLSWAWIRGHCVLLCALIQPTAVLRSFAGSVPSVLPSPSLCHRKQGKSSHSLQTHH